MKDDTKRKAPLLSSTALSKLLYDWQTGGVGVDTPVSQEVCQRLAQVPSLRGPLEHIVLHTTTGDKAREMRFNLRLFDPNAASNDAKAQVNLERLEARSAELAHLIGETKKSVDRAASHVHEARLVADQAAVERDVQQQRVATLRCQALSFRALSAYATGHTSRLDAASESLVQMHPTPGQPAAPRAVQDALLSLRQHLGEGGQSAAPVVPLQACLGTPGVAQVVRRLHSVSCAEGQAVLALLQSTVSAAVQEVRTMGLREERGGDGVSRLRALAAAGQAQHMAMFVEEERLKEEVGRVRRTAGDVCARILARVDHQSTLARQLTEAQARARGVEVQLRELESQTANVALRSAGKSAALERRRAFEGLVAQRDAKRALSADLMMQLGVQGSDVIDGGRAISPTRPQRPLTQIARNVRGVVQTAVEVHDSKELLLLQDALPGTAGRLLDGVAGLSSVAGVEDDNPLFSLEHSVMELARLVAERAALKCTDLVQEAQALKQGEHRSVVSDNVASSVETWQQCVGRFGSVVRSIKDAKELLNALNDDYSALTSATRSLRDQPITRVMNDLERF